MMKNKYIQQIRLILSKEYIKSTFYGEGNEEMFRFVNKDTLTNPKDISIRIKNYLCLSTLIIDYYIMCNYKSFVSSLNEQELVYKSKAIEMIETQNFNYLKDKKVYDDFLANTILLENISPLDRILAYKSLTKEQIDFLSKNNSLFKTEYNLYDIEINHEFVMNYLEYISQYINEDQMYTSLSNFLIELYNIDESETDIILTDFIENIDIDIDDLLDTMMFEDTNNLSSIIRSYYERNKNTKLIQ